MTRRIARVVQATTLLILCSALPADAQRNPDTSCAELGRILVGTVETDRPDACVVIVPRDGLALSLMGTPLPPLTGASRVLFVQAGDSVLALATLVVPAGERPRLVRDLAAAGAALTAVHRHMDGETPALAFLHLRLSGESRTLAASLRQALGAPGRAAPGAAALGQIGIVTGIPCVRLALALGAHEGSIVREPGTCIIGIPGDTTIVDTGGVSAPANLLLPSRAILRQTNDRTTAILVASLTVPASAALATFASLAGAGMDVVAWHTAPLAEQPARATLHLSARGNPLTLVESLKAALDVAQNTGGSSGSGGPSSRIR